MLKSLRLQPLLAKIAVGYMAKIVVISGIAYVGICEWKETKAREMEVRMINRKKHEINDIYVKMLRLSFFCETFMEWSEQDFLLFQKRRRHIDSLLALHPECVRDEPSVLLADIGGWTVDLRRESPAVRPGLSQR